MRDEKTKRAFINFLEDPAHADLRFWQAVCAFSRYVAIVRVPIGAWDHEKLPEAWQDTFYVEADNEELA